MYIYIYTHMHIYIYTHICIGVLKGGCSPCSDLSGTVESALMMQQREREREREREEITQYKE